MHAQMKTCVALSLAAHVGAIALAGSMRPPVAIGGGRMPAASVVVMAELVPPPAPEPVPAAPRAETPVASTPPEAADTPGPAEEKTAPAATSAPPAETDSVPAAEGGTTAGIAPAGNGIPGVRLNLDFARMAWVARVAAQTRIYQRFAPKGFEKMVREALARHPGIGGGTAKISLRNFPSGSVGIEILSSSAELKSALGRVAWKEGPLPARFRIPCSGLNVNVTVAGSKLSVGVEIL